MWEEVGHVLILYLGQNWKKNFVVEGEWEGLHVITIYWEDMTS